MNELVTKEMDDGEFTVESLLEWNQVVKQRMAAEQDYAGKLARLTKSLKGTESSPVLKDFYKKISNEIMSSNKEHLEAYRYFQLQVYEPLQEHVERAIKRSSTSILSMEATDVLLASMENFILYTNPEFSQQREKSPSSSSSLLSLHSSKASPELDRSLSPSYIEYAELENRTSKLSEALTMLRLNPLISKDLNHFSSLKKSSAIPENREMPLPVNMTPSETLKDTAKRDLQDFHAVNDPGKHIFPSSYTKKERVNASQVPNTSSWEFPLMSSPSSSRNNLYPETINNKNSDKNHISSGFPSSKTVLSESDSLKKYFSTHPLITPDGFPIYAYVRALYNYRALLSSEISMRSGDVLIVLNRQKDGWWKGRVVEPTVGPVGLFPSNYIEELNPA
ncbi:src y domain-containing protein [Schizosaccharomyces cryophilus OY26]|uniref:Src y domain-containing protein n=1 Tax=Schizosaccharomyces cryophilus (strain OY26 / ATCC MYA-4695 / CBS 11777 / NBRC 106824 / NRRL Y48691) TaxID=653667 RepID=S9W3B4_SCHCR|nr:src y domain-containing protein [Schizosaccharomyces cryophilus OY26]EPY52435.1 src y domain-containing protein [Schizosaccharomyces cryophilus OY26]